MIENESVKEIIEINDIPSFIEKVKNQTQQQKMRIFFEDIQKQYLYSDIPLSLLYDKCTSLDLNLKGFKTNQIDFDDFTASLLLFKSLNSFSLRFYNKKIQNLDSLFCNVQNIKNVSLNLKNFRKIKLEMNFKKCSQIRSLNLNLSKTTFNSAKDEMKLVEYLQRLDNLEEFKLTIKRINQFQFIVAVPKQTKILLNLFSEVIDIPFCDNLVEFVKDNNIEGIQISSIKPILSLYFEGKGIQVNNPFVISSNMNICQFQPNDFLILKQVPQFSKKIKEVKNYGGFFILGKIAQQNACFKNLIPLIEYNFSEMGCYFYNSTYKQKNQWMIDTSIENQVFIAKLVNVTISIYQYLNFKTTLFYINQLRQSEYLISLQFKDYFNHKNYNSYDYDLEMHKTLSTILGEQINIAQQKSQTKLRYFVFRKTIFDLIPIPDQVFYDLIEIQ